MTQHAVPEYVRARNGDMPGPPESIVSELMALTRNGIDVVSEAVQILYDYGCPFEHIQNELDVKAVLPNRDTLYPYLLAASIVIEQAKTSTLYWGVSDPDSFSYCGYCKQPRPIEEFNDSEHTCDPCFAARKESMK